MDTIMPDYHEARHNRGIAYANRGGYGGAIEDYTSVLRIDPNDAHAMMMLDYVRAKCGD